MSEPRPPLTTTTSILPAMLVVGVALGTLVIFLIIDLVTSPRVTPSSPRVAIVGGMGLDAHNAGLRACQSPGTPPSNISGALVLPVSTHSQGAAVHANSGAGDYDCLRHFTTRTSAGALLGFYEAHLESQGWSLFSTGTSHALAQMLFQKAGSDTFYWVAGVTVNSSSNGRLSWTFRIYQNSSTI